jgi:hypothetical protein
MKIVYEGLLSKRTYRRCEAPRSAWLDEVSRAVQNGAEWNDSVYCNVHPVSGSNLISRLQCVEPIHHWSQRSIELLGATFKGRSARNSGHHVFEDNILTGEQKARQNLLGSSFSNHSKTLKRLEDRFAEAKRQFLLVANQIRNHSYHVNPELRDYGFLAWVKRTDNGFAVALPNIYVDRQGNPIDLVEVFVSTHQSIKLLICDVVDMLLEFYIQQDGAPSNRCYQLARSPYGRMMVSLGPGGFEYSEFMRPENQARTWFEVTCLQHEMKGAA